MVPRENENNAYVKFGGTRKEYYGIFRNGLLKNNCSIILPLYFSQNWDHSISMELTTRKWMVMN